MDKELSSYLASVRPELEEIVEKLRNKFGYVSLLASDCQGKKITVSESNIEITDSEWQERGFVVRVYNRGIYSEFSFNNIPSVKSVCKRITEAVEVNELLDKAIYVKASKTNKIKEETINQDFSLMNKYEHVEEEDIIRRCKKIIDNSMEKNEYIISARCVVEYLKISKIFISNNKNMSQVYAWADATYQCVLNKDETTRFNYGGETSVSLKECLEKLEKAISGVNNDGLLLLDATHIVPGEYDCITTPTVTGLLAHEAFGHGVEMDMFVKNRALAVNYMNKKVGSELVTMHDGAIPYLDVSSYFFDDEGVLAHDTVEIKNGILINGIADTLAASALKIQPTGNGKRSNYQRKAYTRMTSTYFEPGKSKLSDMVKSIEYGFLIDGELSGMEDPKNWGIQCVCLIGKEIKNGKLTGNVVSPLIMTGYVPDLLNSISMVSEDFKLYGNGYCAKGYKEEVKTSIGGPYLKAKVKLG